MSEESRFRDTEIRELNREHRDRIREARRGND